ncbi:MAG: hypothetical protein J6V80_07545 [Clostridia bacterium]|nr:hypothetical protein [Clostridia bacterium]
MSNKDPKNTNNTDNNYKLNTDAVDRLVNANNKNYKNTDPDPGRQYRSKRLLDKIPAPIKALFIKFWFNGAVCFFIYWGLGMYIWDTLDMMVVLGIVLGIVNDLLVKNTFHFFSITPNSNNKWMMFPKKKYWTFFTNILYYMLIVFMVAETYSAINLVLNSLNSTEEQIIYLGVEPILFGVICVAYDMLFIGMKNLAIKIITDAKEKAEVNND